MDPEWGGPDYKKHHKVILQYADYICHEFIGRLLGAGSVAFLKLPKNYDIEILKKHFNNFYVDV